MNANHSLSFLLQQHTPMIHFQHDQAGATLRPSELKAKLDRWIIGKMTGHWGLAEKRLKAFQDHEEGRYVPWLKRGPKAEHPALDYQVKVKIIREHPTLRASERTSKTEEIIRGGKRKLKTAKIPTFFADTGGDGNEFQLVFHDLVLVDIHSTNEDLIKHIKEGFAEFLAWTNFGMRQSKGFGSYFLHPKDPHYPDVVLFQPFYKFEVDVSKNARQYNTNDALDAYYNLFERIDLFYKTLRSGNSYPFYFKSLLWRYLKEEKEGIQWDKKSIKTYYEEETGNQCPKTHKFQESNNASPRLWQSGKNGELWRDLLGLSTDQSWKGYHPNKLTKEVKNKDVDRLKSPIHFKPVKHPDSEDHYLIYFQVPGHIHEASIQPSDEVPESQILGKPVDIWFGSEQAVNEKLTLNFPATFDYREYLDWAVQQNPISSVEPSHRNRKEVGSLKMIFDQFK
jgi:hypothetical protein